MKKLSIAMTASLLLLATSGLFAHSDLSTSSPADGSVLKAAPATIKLGFTEDVRLLRFSIAGSDAEVIATGFSPSAADQDHFAVSLPELDDDSYTVNLAIMGGDGHLVEKSFGFTVDASAEAESAAVVEQSETPATPAAGHSH